MLKIIKLITGELEENCYLVYEEGTHFAAVIDPGDDAYSIKAELENRGLVPGLILLTHGHFDHIGAVDEIAETDTKLYIHTLDACMLSDPKKNESVGFGVAPLTISKEYLTVEEDDEIALGTYSFKVLHTPGHSMGSVCYDIDGNLFTGDTMFENGYGRTDLYGGDFSEMRKSLHRLFPLRNEKKIHPGHG